MGQGYRRCRLRCGYPIGLASAGAGLRMRAGRSVSKQTPGTPATVALSAAGIPFTPHAYEHDPSVTSFGAEAATALGLDTERVFKTLMAEVDGGLIVAIVPVAGKLDLKAVAAAAGGKKATMANPALAERKSGYVVGGISPIGQKTAFPTFVDESAQLFDTIYISGGRRGFDIELTPSDLIAVTTATVVAITHALGR